MSDHSKKMTASEALEGFRAVTRPETLRGVAHLVESAVASGTAGSDAAYQSSTGAYRIVVPDNTHGGRGFDLPSVMFKNRFLYLEGPVTQAAVWELQKQIHYLCSDAVLWHKGKVGDVARDELHRERIRRITVYIDSPGGYVDWGLELHDYIREAESITGEPVVVIMKTQAASMGSLLMQSGTNFMRLAFPRSLMMIHGLSYGMQGKLEQHMDAAAGSIVRAAQLYEIYINKMLEAAIGSGRLVDNGDGTLTNPANGSVRTLMERKKEILNWLKVHMENRDSFLNVAECLKKGLIDFIIFDEATQMLWYDHVYWYMGLKEPAKREDTGELDGVLEASGIFRGNFSWTSSSVPLTQASVRLNQMSQLIEAAQTDKGAEHLLKKVLDRQAMALKGIRALQADNLKQALAVEEGYAWIQDDLISDYSARMKSGNRAVGAEMLT